MRWQIIIVPYNCCHAAFSKIYQRVSLKQLTEYMVQKNRLSLHQSGNKRLHSPETLNIFITDTVLNAMDNKEVTALGLLDLSKAFDSIAHSLLLTKLSTLGLSKVFLEWFKSYLSQRGQ